MQILKKGARLKEAEKITGLRARKILFYADKRFFIFRVQRKGEGRGSIITYTAGNLVDLMIIKELSDYGMTISKIKNIIDTIHNDSNFKEKYEIHEFKNYMENLPVYLHIFNQHSGEFKVEFRESTPTAMDMEEFPSCITINYSRIIKKINGN